MAYTLDDLKDLIRHDAKVGSTLDPIDDEVLRRSSGKISSANNIASLNPDDSLNINGVNIDLEPKIESYTSFNDTISDLKKDGIDVKSLEKMAGKEKDVIAKEGKQIFGKLGKATEAHGKAIEAIKVDQTKTIEALNKDFGKKLKDLQKTATRANADTVREQIEVLRDNHQEVLSHVNSHFEKLTDPHTNALGEIKSLSADIEKATGLNAAEHMKPRAVALVGSDAAKASKGIVGDAKYAEKGMMGRAAADVKANWGKSFGGKAKVTVGAIGVVDGVRRVIGATFGSKDPDKQGDSKAGQLVVGLGEIGGGVLLARMGGANIAKGLGH
jgi:hypothetical protein